MGDKLRPRLAVAALVVLGVAGLVSTLALVFAAFADAIFSLGDWTDEVDRLWPWMVPSVVGLLFAIVARRREYIAAFVVLLVVDVAGLLGPSLLGRDVEPGFSVPINSAVQLSSVSMS
ncbi:hypothetical protein VSH64_42110 [Amycolatopsis rhabdoformis]|uniref:Phosphoesterase n=1 Tax=Amycolatopsis rhabdoformis TaxID=1448059 RepID=A0ABZ1I732_9PSEU|nr:hypothetical protein [Amycolatopsis rhabdoformis]WSE29333.1 hypothetical protein VSH64_42110 [Amycolatopsis rhabdoformis]